VPSLDTLNHFYSTHT